MLADLNTQSPVLKAVRDWRNALFPDMTSIIQRSRFFAHDDRLRSEKIFVMAFNCLDWPDWFNLSGIGNSRWLKDYFVRQSITTAGGLLGRPLSDDELRYIKRNLNRLGRGDELDRVIEVAVAMVMERLSLPEVLLLKAVFPDKDIRVPEDAQQENELQEIVQKAIEQLEPEHAFFLTASYGLHSVDTPMSPRVIVHQFLRNQISQREVRISLGNAKEQLRNLLPKEVVSPFFK